VFVFSGKVSVDEVADRMGVTIEREGFETVGGYLLSHLGRMPYMGERFDVDELTAEVLEVERRRINKVRLKKREPEPEEE
jgi:magnesium and cobalt transporter